MIELSTYDVECAVIPDEWQPLKTNIKRKSSATRFVNNAMKKDPFPNYRIMETTIIKLTKEIWRNT